MDDAYEKGYQANLDGKWTTDNPYDPITHPKEASDWDNGFDAAE